MTDETTTEQLAEIEEQAADTAATEYTPPDGWRVLAVGERLRDGDVTVCRDGSQYPADRLGGWVGSNQRYIRPIEPEPQPAQVREGRWRTRNGLVKDVTAMPTDHEDFTTEFPWWDGKEETWTKHGHLLSSGECPGDLVEYLGPIEPQPEPQAQSQAVTIEELRSEVSYVQRLLGESRQRVTQLEELVGSLRTINEATEKTVRLAGQENTDLKHRLDVVSAEWAEQAATCNGLQQQVENQQQEYERQKSRIEFLETLNAGNGAAIGDYIAKVAKLQSLVDTARQQLEASATECDSVTTRLEAVAAERDEQAETIRKLQTQLEAVKGELVQERLERNRSHNQVLRLTAELDNKTTECRNVRIELDAAQQAPQAETVTTAPTSKDDRFEEGWDAGTSQAVETIVEWTEPFRRCGSERLAWMVMQNLPHIMRTLTGLTPED